jgi:glycogen debranching enzyme
MTKTRDLRVRPDLLYVASGWNVLVTDVHGCVGGVDPHGFFARNARVLSLEQVTVDGKPPQVFSTANVGVHAQQSYAILDNGDDLPSRAAYLVCEHFVGEGLRTRLSILSFADQPRRWTVRVVFDADFADIDDVQRGQSRQQADVVADWNGDSGRLALRYMHPRLDYAVLITGHSSRIRYVDKNTFEADLDVEPGGRAGLEFTTEPLVDGILMPAPPATFAEPDDVAGLARARLTAELATLRTTNLDVAAAWQTATCDLARLPLGEPGGPAAPMAGLPSYQQIFGRDTLTASWQAMLAGPTMLRDSLLLNAQHIGERIDDWRDEEPGKLMHQARHGPVSRLGIDPFSAYFGDWSTSPAFPILLGQYYAWTADIDLVRQLLPTTRKVLDWLDRYGDLDRDGFLEYQQRSAAGVKNQGWKDSETAIIDEYGDTVPNPLATSELQAYWHAALQFGAMAIAAAGDRLYAATLLAKAARLKRRFHPAYWMPEHGSYALALGPDKQQVRSVNSNDGHLLAGGIVPQRLAPVLARRLLAPDMFSGWGIRTLSADHAAYNPFSYHRGSVWPVEAGTIGLGLARYGQWPQLHRLAKATFDAAALFEGHRLPEVISGLPRTADYPHPGIYPTACSPQAWSASAIIALIQALLGLRPIAAINTIMVDPHLPDWLPEVTIEGVHIGRKKVDLQAVRKRDGRTAIRTRGDRIAVVRRRSRGQVL